MFVEHLPLKDDLSEIDAVFSCLAGLLEMRHPDLMTAAILPKTLHAIAVALTLEEVEDELKGRLLGALKAACTDGEAGPLMQTALGMTPPEVNAALLPHLQ